MQRDIDEWTASFTEREAVVTPSPLAFQQAGRVLAALATVEGLDLKALRPAFHHDVLLVCTVREQGRTLVTADADHFTRIQRQLRGFHFVSPFPR